MRRLLRLTLVLLAEYVLVVVCLQDDRLRDRDYTLQHRGANEEAQAFLHELLVDVQRGSLNLQLDVVVPGELEQVRAHRQLRKDGQVVQHTLFARVGGADDEALLRLELYVQVLVIDCSGVDLRNREVHPEALEVRDEVLLVDHEPSVVDVLHIDVVDGAALNLLGSVVRLVSVQVE